MRLTYKYRLYPTKAQAAFLGGQLREACDLYNCALQYHLQAYADEQCFRFNERETTDAARFILTMQQIVGRRLTYKELTGKEEVLERVPG